MSLHQKVASSRYSIKDFSKHIAAYLEKEWNDAYYQRVRDLLKGERSTVTDAEQEAFDYWAYTFDNPFEASKKGFLARNMDKQLDQLWKYLRTGIFNKRDAKRIIRELRKLT